MYVVSACNYLPCIIACMPSHRIHVYYASLFNQSIDRSITDNYCIGNKDATVVPVGVVQVWNTFFPDSHFDSEREPGKLLLVRYTDRLVSW